MARVSATLPSEPPMNPADLTAYLAAPTPAETEFRRLFRPDAVRTVFDIGACEGEDSIRFARCFPRAQVFAFEPLPSNQALVRANFARYAAANAELVPVALSDRAGSATFHVSSGRPPDLFAGESWNYGNKSSSLLPAATGGPMHGWIEFKEEIAVATDTLDAFCARRGIDRIDLIHLDVQGAEQLVLNGAARLLPRTAGIWLEVAAVELYRGQALDRDLARFMRAQGFALGHVRNLGLDTGEGDHFYVNLRHPRAWLYLAGSRGTAAARRARMAAGRWKNRLFGPRSPSAP